MKRGFNMAETCLTEIEKYDLDCSYSEEIKPWEIYSVSLRLVGATGELCSGYGKRPLETAVRLFSEHMDNEVWLDSIAPIEGGEFIDRYHAFFSHRAQGAFPFREAGILRSGPIILEIKKPKPSEIEFSCLCETCIQERMCERYRRVQEACLDPIIPGKAVVVECEAYKKGERKWKLGQ